MGIVVMCWVTAGVVLIISNIFLAFLWFHSGSNISMTNKCETWEERWEKWCDGSIWVKLFELVSPNWRVSTIFTTFTFFTHHSNHLINSTRKTHNIHHNRCITFRNSSSKIIKFDEKSSEMWQLKRISKVFQHFLSAELYFCACFLFFIFFDFPRIVGIFWGWKVSASRMASNFWCWMTIERKWRVETQWNWRTWICLAFCRRHCFNDHSELNERTESNGHNKNRTIEVQFWDSMSNRNGFIGLARRYERDEWSCSMANRMQSECVGAKWMYKYTSSQMKRAQQRQTKNK